MTDREPVFDALVLVRDGTIFGPNGTEIDFRTPDYSVWLTIKAANDADAEAVAAALETAFPEDQTATEGPTVAERGPVFAARHELAALLLARSNNTEDAMGEFLPQAVYDSLYARKMLTLASDITGESWAVTTPAGDEHLAALLRGAETTGVTHGRHCPCSACAREDWTEIDLPCGMHGEDCPALYAPVRAANSQPRAGDDG